MDIDLFLQNLVAGLLADGYQPMHYNRFEPQTAPPTILLMKQVGAVCYAAAVYRLTEQPERFAALRSAVSEQLNRLREQADIRYLVRYDIAVSADENPEALAFVSTGEEYMGQPFYEMRYAVTLADKQLFFAKNQPQDLTKMKETLHAALAAKEGAAPPVDLAADPLAAARIRPKTKNAYLTYALIAVNTLLFLLMEQNGGSETINTLLRFGAMQIDLFLQGEYYRVLTALFLHIGLTHLLYNSFSLYIFGTRIERHYGRGAFLIIYIAAGLSGNLLNALFAPGAVLAGASSGIFGLLGAALSMTQVTRKHMDGLNFYTMLIFVVSGVLFGFLEPNIGQIAHIGGLAAGYLTGLIILTVRKAQRNDRNDKKSGIGGAE